MNAETITMTGAQLKQQREDCGLTQPQLAACVGKSRSALAHWESGRTAIPADVEPRLRAVLDMVYAIRPSVVLMREVCIERADAQARAKTAEARATSLEIGFHELSMQMSHLRTHLNMGEQDVGEWIHEQQNVADPIRSLNESWSTDARAQFVDYDSGPVVLGTQVELSLPLADTVDERNREDCMRTLVKLTCKRVAEWAEGQAVPVSQMWEAYKLLAAAEE